MRCEGLTVRILHVVYAAREILIYLVSISLKINNPFSMSFGWGVGDILAISELAIKVYTAYKDAPEDYRHISEEVVALQILIDKAAQHFESTTLSSHDRHNGLKVVKGCQSVLEDLDFLIEKYQSLASSNKRLVFKRIKLGREDITALRGRLISNTVLLSGFVRRFFPRLFCLRNSTSTNIFVSVVNILKSKHS